MELAIRAVTGDEVAFVEIIRRYAGARRLYRRIGVCGAASTSDGTAMSGGLANVLEHDGGGD